MAKPPLTETIKVRLPGDWKTELQKLADAEHVDISVIARRAFDELLVRTRRRKPTAARC